MKKTVFIIALSFFCIQAKSQNIDLNNTTDYIRVQKNGETGYTRAFGLNGSNQLYIGSIEKTIGNMYFFNKGTGHLMTLNPSGNLGIGTTNPGAKLDILSNTGQTESLMRFKISDAPSDYLQIANSTGSANQFIPLIKGYHETDNRYSLSIMGSTSDAMDNGSNALINFNARRSNSVVQTRPLFVWTNYDQKMMTMSANGNLGIGTTSPQEKFQIGNTYTFHDGGHKVIGFLYKPSGGVDLDPLQYSSEIRFDPVNGNFHLGTSNTVTAGPTAKLSINKTGNVGIGTTFPDAKLAVNGNIHTKEVKVDLVGWPDYVFESDYKLPTLQEVENHIAEKGHLENIPSAAAVAENGIQLGKMNAKLLQKIEELTLYMIEQNKKTDTLIKEVEILKQKNSELEKKMK
ncbi:hypothetical protein [uncultured Aquimarina sp.]|uniref:hypothetical protein n=1 Tax=uncultured Aquimarina sp. TaxID=575652 RepID=UPI00262EA97C|nr:hypothetical protein [uncultured Aquimarina sp.]